ncbi:hypothetical protein BDW02DRAFT_193763 [Decorospora gaudefroyi]|uniref:Zn(2)-C6 fungal-type domain-containing protein n=1 Tax=Decorospora gaudefroyi TaxID=184978 RepID=A0A6A5JZ75_9PLEO|nr:hypothetical protein BDW02DRAFT_193763 [Decorospora gaudefroyi]
MPPGRSRILNPQGRQKSCSECAKAKRKCGLEQPRCARCARQHLACVYPPQPRSQAPIPHHATPGTRTDFDATELSLEIQDEENAGFAFAFDIPPTSIPTGSPVDIFDFDFSAGASSLDALANMIDSSTNQEDQMAMQRSYTRVKKPFSVGQLSTFAKARVEYTIEHIKLAPKWMVDENCTPWSHSMLYEEYMPRSLQDAHAACALYITKNDINAEHVARHIASRAEELINAPSSNTPIEILARAHALMLYQIMFLFGGDIGFHQKAEALLPYLEEMGGVLLPLAAEQTDTEGSLPLYPSAAARAAWKSYTFRESLRRTALSIFHITVMCTLLGGELKTCTHIPLSNQVTLSAHLWNANNAFDFALAWNEKNHFVIKELDFTSVLKHGQPDDLDVFSKMILVGLKGIDDMRGWFHTRGGTL